MGGLRLSWHWALRSSQVPGLHHRQHEYLPLPHRPADWYRSGIQPAQVRKVWEMKKLHDIQRMPSIIYCYSVPCLLSPVWLVDWSPVDCFSLSCVSVAMVTGSQDVSPWSSRLWLRSWRLTLLCTSWGRGSVKVSNCTPPSLLNRICPPRTTASSSPIKSSGLWTTQMSIESPYTRSVLL